MAIKPQGTKILQISITVFFCMIVLVPAAASENPESTLRAGTIIDQPVFNAQGQELGELEDLVVKRNGSVKKALISVGGLLELGDKLISVNFKSLRLAEEKFILDITQKQITDRPEFDYRKHGLFTNYHYRLYPFGTMPGPYGPREGGMPPRYHRRWTDEGGRTHGDMHEDMHGRQNWYNPWNQAYYPARMLASVVLGQTVVNKQAEEVATVEDVIISTTGKVKKLILSYGGFLDIGDRLVTVPYRPFGFTGRGITYDINRRELENLPKFSGMK